MKTKNRRKYASACFHVRMRVRKKKEKKRNVRMRVWVREKWRIDANDYFDTSMRWVLG